MLRLGGKPFPKGEGMSATLADVVLTKKKQAARDKLQEAMGQLGRQPGLHECVVCRPVLPTQLGKCNRIVEL